MLVACTLPAETKTGCRRSADCIDDRICVDLECQPGGCEPACELACDRADECGVDLSDCEDECTRGDGLLGGLSPGDCKAAWDGLSHDDADCGTLECLHYCNDLCVAALDCLLVVDAGTCTLGCVENRPGCTGTVPTSCADIPGDVRCYEVGGC
jgi:hypothetical protein